MLNPLSQERSSMQYRLWSAPLALLTLATGVLAAPTFSLGPPTARFGSTAGDQYGVSVASCDLDRDGVPETLVGARDADPNGVMDAGSVFVYSGRTGALLKRFDGTVASGVFGISVACGDINRDGRPDVVIGAANQWKVFVYSGKDWSLIRELEPVEGAFQNGYSLACADVNRDRYVDIISGAPNFGRSGNGAGRVTVYSGKDGTVLLQDQGSFPGDLFGHSVAAGDVNRDGHEDLVVGSPNTPVDGREGAGRIMVFSGKDGALLRNYAGQVAGDNLGGAVACSDLNGDRYADILVGGHAIDVNGILDAGSIFVYSGKNGTLLRRINGTAVADHVGYSLACGRIDGDKVPDIVTGSIQEETPPANTFERLWLYSGKTGKLIQRVEQTAKGDLFGLTLALNQTRAGKVTSVLVGAPFADPNELQQAGTVWQFPIVKSRR